MPARVRKAKTVPEAQVSVDTVEDTEQQEPLATVASCELNTSEHVASSGKAVSPPSSTSSKRKWDTIFTAPAKKPRASTSSAPAVNNLKDSLEPNLILVSIGLNPGITTGLKGEAYSHPSNRYWPTLHASGITPVRHYPRDTHSLTSLYGLGHTNIVAHIASVGGKDLKPQDYMDGAADLDEKIRTYRPGAVALVGKGIFEEWFRFKTGRKMNKKEKDAWKYGWQDEQFWVGRKKGEYEGARTFVVTTTSGMSSTHTTEERVAIWKPLGDWFAPKREEWIKARSQNKEADGTATPVVEQSSV